MHFESVGSEGYFGYDFFGSFDYFVDFDPGDSGWGSLTDPVEAGTAPQILVDDCGPSGSISGSLADRSDAPPTFDGRTTSSGGSLLPFFARGTAQYVLDLTISQGAISIFDVLDEHIWSTLQSSGEYPLGTLQAGESNLHLKAESGPPAIWTAAVRAVPVAINELSFIRTCISPGTGIPATFSTTGDTNVSALVRRTATGNVVRNLGSFDVEMGDGSIPWDGRNGSGGGVPNGFYALELTSNDPQGHSTSAEVEIYVSSSGPAVSRTSPRVIRPGQSAAFKVAEAGCGVASVTATVDGEQTQTYGENEYGYSSRPLPSGGLIVFSPRRGWKLGAHRWRIEATDTAGNTRVAAGQFGVRRRRASRCVVPRVVGRRLRVAKRQVRRSGCRVGRIRFKRRSGRRAGRVLAVRPRPGTRRRPGSRVHLRVGRR